MEEVQAHAHDGGAAAPPEKWWPSFVAGAAGGIFCVAIGHPFETIKTRVQTAGLQASMSGKSHEPFKGPLHCLKDTIRNEGILAVYKGAKTPLLLIPALNMFGFGIYSNALRRIQAGNVNCEDTGSGGVKKKLGVFNSETYFGRLPGQAALAGFVSGLSTTVIVSPIELVKARLQTQYGKKGDKLMYRGPIDVVVKTVKAEGIRGMYRGYPLLCTAYAPGVAIWFWTNEVVRRMLTGEEQPDAAKLSTWSILFAGGTAGVVAYGVIFPVDLLRARYQTAPLGTYNGFLDAFRKTMRQGGVREFYRGWTASVARAFPADAALFFGYEYAVRAMKAAEVRKHKRL
eukprot:TRINITY_DN1083_c0_g1_i3.p2 TRINITY_DN1083_c0_g1~~TRINITY_DN1083_c0_g1_i3.p2  ORF type:complete len:343 (+),score=33.91 TRINITY_DN1083_c0_g1_i3:143-1171(+)